MNQRILTVTDNHLVARDVYKMQLTGDTSAITRPGQFVNLLLSGLYLRRPISVCDWDEDTLTLIYKVVGEGTEQMAAMENGTKVDILMGLGNGFDVTKAGETPVLIGGGVGVPPLYGLAKHLRQAGKNVTVAIGAASRDDVLLAKELTDLGCTVKIATVDGSAGEKGFVTGLLTGDYSYSYACGPIPMLKAVYGALSCDGEYSFEERMGCGFGACMGCSCKTKTGNKRICKDGPVLTKEEILW